MRVRPHREIIGRIRSMASGSPETMTDKVPARAPGGPTDIGQSTHHRSEYWRSDSTNLDAAVRVDSLAVF